MKYLPSSNSALFLDRDGVLNERIIGDYVRNIEQLKVFKEAGPLLSVLRPSFKRIFVVTNQQGIGKGLMNEADLHLIHKKLIDELGQGEALIDYIFHCPSLKNAGDQDRKPSIGMALKAKAMYPDISLEHSLMIGDSVSDIEFGKNAGMASWFIHPERLNQPLADASFTNLFEALQTLVDSIALSKGEPVI